MDRKLSVDDRETAARLAKALTLVSHSSFQRSLSKQIEDLSAAVPAPIALFAVREMTRNTRSAFSSQLIQETGHSTISAVAEGNDLGSEARVAATIRSLCRTRKSLLMNHPNVGEMRRSKCRSIVVVDDLIGSGKRTREFLEALWESRSIRSWWSRKKVQFYVVCYASTEDGAKRVGMMKCRPDIRYDRVCPTLRNIPWSQTLKSEVSDLCRNYAPNTAAGAKYIWGYQGSAAMLVFEHGCPNNVPAILWSEARRNTDWNPLFPSKTVYSDEASAFPLELARRDPIALLIDAEQAKLARTIRLAGPISRETLLLLAYAEKGIRSSGALSFATGLNEEACRTMIQLCVKLGLLTLRFRLTSAGLAELNAARRAPYTSLQVASIGTNNYHPTSLRKTI